MVTATKTTDVRRADRQTTQGKEQLGIEKLARRSDTRPAKPDKQEKQAKRKDRPPKVMYPNPTPRLSVSQKALKELRLVAVAYSAVEREFFPTEEAYQAEKEVESRAAQVLRVMEGIGIPGRLYSADEYLLTNLLVDRPDLVLNLVDTLRGRDGLQASIPGALELLGIPYTGARMRGLVIGNDRNLVKQVLKANDIPTPDYQYIRRSGTKVNPDLGLPLIVKLNEGGGSVGIDDGAVKETLEGAQEQVDQLINAYRMPVIVERFIVGPEITAVVFEDRRRRHVFLGQKAFGVRPDGKYEFTSLASYDRRDSYHYAPVQDQELTKRIEQYVTKVFKVLHSKDYSKYDIRVDEKTGTPYFTDCNPNTAFGPSLGLPFTEVVDTLYGVKFEKVLQALLSRYARKIKARRAEPRA
jgi:D-alanine-D-alanine ligase